MSDKAIILLAITTLVVIVWVCCSLILKYTRHARQELSNLYKKYENLISGFVMWLVILFFLFLLYPTAEKELKKRIWWTIDYSSNGKIVIKESICPFGSWLKPNLLILENKPKPLVVQTNNSMIYIPYKNIRQIEYRKGHFWDKLVIHVQGGIFSSKICLYFFNSKDPTEELKDIAQVIAQMILE